ncbi:hypothetical protein PGT21_021769 [Puccinia graminis f. sp. tritici]|uniref:CxC1-like cysteine cluster associated with KDZ transposases domain-containing protein n=1 Tax=Puccinia graminis f. sp. tritici TaxID=56615 RepID=A0A5B0QBF2_PUCGR|nr:hypothetical protein PGT21_034714 [Puccinia graminis f. sp. tritici]KAA1110449.1 hypothetical protein PGT21_021769 [Puccinia graminis f. sp. tritici]
MAPTPARRAPARNTPARNPRSSQPTSSRSIAPKPTRTNRINPFRHETPTAQMLRERNQARNQRSFQRMQASQRGGLLRPSSSRAPRSHPQTLESSGEPNGPSQPSDDLWDQFDTTEWETLQESPAPAITSISQRIYDFNALRSRQRLAENWNRNIPQLHGVYLWLKVKTGNWTFDCAFDSFEDQVCQCNSFTYRTIDLFDLMWQKRIRQKFCKCIPDVVRLLTLGYIGSSPVRPRTAFSVRLLQFHNLAWQWCSVATLPFTEMLSRWLEERSEKLLNAERTKRRELRKCFSAAVDIFRLMLLKTNELVSTSLQLSKTQKLARSSCPACFGPNAPEDTHHPRTTVKDSLVVCLDGNFQHRHNAKAGGTAPLTIPPIFLETERVSQMRQSINNLGTCNEPVSYPIPVASLHP